MNKWTEPEEDEQHENRVINSACCSIEEFIKKRIKEDSESRLSIEDQEIIKKTYKKINKLITKKIKKVIIEEVYVGATLKQIVHKP